MNWGLHTFFSTNGAIENIIRKMALLSGIDADALRRGIFYIAVIFLGGLIIAVISAIGGLGTYAERKISADMQKRQGPNRVGPYGILQFLADGIKLLLKEDTTPQGADKVIYNLAPLLCMVGVFSTLSVLPFSSYGALVNLDVGAFYIIGISSLVGLGVFLGGYASNSKWSLLGGLRGAGQIISYEIPITLCVIGICLLSGSISLHSIVQKQGDSIFSWNVFNNPFTFVSFFVYSIASLAETNRAPFDLPEAESELVSGYHTEYSGMKFSFFALAEYAEIFIVSSLSVALFLGGYNLPFFNNEVIRFCGENNLILISIQTIVFFVKTFFLYYMVIVIRWTLPRLRVDQLMSICWKYLTPICMFNILGLSLYMYLKR